MMMHVLVIMYANLRCQREKSSAQTGPVSELSCVRCGLQLGEAVCTLELMEQWINEGCGEDSTEYTCGEERAFRPEVLSDVRLLTHRVVARRAGIDTPAKTGDITLAADLEQVCFTVAMQLMYV